MTTCATDENDTMSKTSISSHANEQRTTPHHPSPNNNIRRRVRILDTTRKVKWRMCATIDHRTNTQCVHNDIARPAHPTTRRSCDESSRTKGVPVTLTMPTFQLQRTNGQTTPKCASLTRCHAATHLTNSKSHPKDASVGGKARMYADMRAAPPEQTRHTH